MPASVESGGTPDAGSSPPAPSVAAIFLAFLQIGMMGFGGLAASAYHIIVERRRWIESKEFIDLFAVCTVLPGGNIINASVILGDRYRGLPGAVAGVAGLLLMPLAILMGLAMIYEATADLPAVRAAMAGSASAVAGLSIGTAAKMAKGLERTAFTAFAVFCVFVLIGVLRVSLPLVLLIAVPLSLAFIIWQGPKRS